MKNPLRKRYIRELKKDFGKYLVIFLFMVMLISLVSGYLVVSDSIKTTFYEGYEKYNVEDGNITFTIEPAEEVLEKIEKKANLKFYSMEYSQESIEGKNGKLRIFKNRDYINLPNVWAGSIPVEADEIALDRVFADNNDYKIGDILVLNGKEYEISGLVALVDYGCLFENVKDMMFDSIGFGVALMTDEGYDRMNSLHNSFCYSWKYDTSPKDEKEENTKSEELIRILSDVIEEYDTGIMEKYLTSVVENPTGDFCEIELLDVESYIPRYQNKAITYCMDDMGSDEPTFMLFCYIVVAILAFVFAVTTNNTIASEAGVIGTLRALGYSRGQMVRHYILMPVIVTLMGALVGNILGYTVLVEVMKGIFYKTFSLATYENRFNTKAFINTTVIPILIMAVINLFVLIRKMQLSPMKFLRRDLNKKKNKRAMLLNKKLPFMLRFRIRIILQNISAYITLFVGIVFGGLIAVFGIMFGPLLDDYSDMIINSRISNYQYVLIGEAETETEGAEKYCITGLDSTKEGYMVDEISVYGIEKDSVYISKDIPKGSVLISNGISKKFKLNEGDTLTLKDSFDESVYEFKIGGIYTYDAALAVFMNRNEFNETFDLDKGYFNGYFSNEKIVDIEDDLIATTITEEDLVKVANQMIYSMGNFMMLFQYFGVAMFLLLMYLMTKQIIEKNMQSIAMTKILGFENVEIGGLYLLSTSFVVVVSLLVSIPLIDWLLRLCFEEYLYTEMTGYIPYIVSNSVYIEMVIMGILSYIFVCVIMFRKIGRISKSEALKNVE